MSQAITYWWKKYQNLKALTEEFRKEYNIKTVEECVEFMIENWVAK